jgi:hypothetical protein
MSRKVGPENAVRVNVKYYFTFPISTTYREFSTARLWKRDWQIALNLGRNGLNIGAEARERK